MKIKLINQKCVSVGCTRLAETGHLRCNVCLIERRRAARRVAYAKTDKQHSVAGTARIYKRAPRIQKHDADGLCIICSNHFADQQSLRTSEDRQGYRRKTGSLCPSCYDQHRCNAYEKQAVNNLPEKQRPATRLFWRQYLAAQEAVATVFDAKPDQRPHLLDDVLELLSRYLAVAGPAAGQCQAMIVEARKGLTENPLPYETKIAAYTYAAIAFAVSLSPLRLLEGEGNRQFIALRADFDGISQNIVDEADIEILRQRYFSLAGGGSLYARLLSALVARRTAEIYIYEERGVRGATINEEIFNEISGPALWMFNNLCEGVGIIHPNIATETIKYWRNK